MKSGLELDKLVAEKVMGWHNSYGWITEKGWYVGDFQPSKNILHAWMVVEFLKDKFDFTILYHNNDSWIFTLQNILPPKDEGLADVQEYKVEADTPELAICLTALKSIGYEMEETV